VEERDLIMHTIKLRIMSSTFKGLPVPLDSVDSAPSAREGERDGVAANAAEGVEDDLLGLGGFGGDVLGYSAGGRLTDELVRLKVGST
jgi:hypothetical protein